MQWNLLNSADALRCQMRKLVSSYLHTVRLQAAAASHLNELLVAPKDLLASVVVLCTEVTPPVLMHKCIVLCITCST